MTPFRLCLLVSSCLGATQLTVAELRIGIIDTDTSHVPAFSRTSP